jgi:hypothetical protein
MRKLPAAKAGRVGVLAKGQERGQVALPWFRLTKS